ncbi:hypothetical protein [Rhizosphaericola mali]|uniref:Uncharacterized protein n=1 Tax=Rhizosphaericola mali TaxID=2545455 RepID=A0A5P2G2L3_9BACT|nr:hypothetical protein [Rhizosphaericola mali]QES88062.1 hypothetical protein E0W69_005080 [Rhizosphaericola mali]
MPRVKSYNYKNDSSKRVGGGLAEPTCPENTVACTCRDAGGNVNIAFDVNASSAVQAAAIANKYCEGQGVGGSGGYTCNSDWSC